MSSQRVLNVNDSEAWRYLTTRTLIRAGFDVVEARTGAEAARLMWEHPALVVLDVRLPDISGIELCRMVKGNPELANIPVILFSATFTTTEMRESWADARPDHVYAGPLDADELVRLVRGLLPSQSSAG